MNIKLNNTFEETDFALKIIRTLTSELFRTYDLIEFPAIRRGVLYEYATMDDFDQVSDCLSKIFENEPKQKCLGLSYDEMKAYVVHHVKIAITQESVMVARDPSTNKILGAETWQDLTDSTRKFEESHPKFAPNFKLWTFFKDNFIRYYEYLTNNPIKPGDVFYVRMAGVDVPLEYAAEKKIGNYFYHFTSVIAFKRGYQAGFGIESGPIPQYLALKFGNHIFDSLFYKDFEFGGENIFENIHFKSFTPEVNDSSIISIFRFVDPQMMIKAIRLLPDFMAQAKKNLNRSNKIL